ncbi:MAG: adenylate kinase [Candidatus Aenigmatarchaeota archaeon]
MKIVMLGVKGSGKGTYASRLAPLLGIPHISTGDIFRDNIKNGTELGKKVEEILKAGKFVSDELTIKIVEERLEEPDCKNGFILDGFPRTPNQADGLNNVEKLDFVIYLDVLEDVIIRRISTRVTCKKCKTIYNTEVLKPKEEGICDNCGGELYQRDDDKPEIARKRIEQDEKNLKPLLDYYKNKGLLKIVKCVKFNDPPENYVNQILEIVGAKE